MTAWWIVYPNLVGLGLGLPLLAIGFLNRHLSNGSTFEFAFSFLGDRFLLGAQFVRAFVYNYRVVLTFELGFLTFGT
jgi:hypothetical protein